MTDNLPAVPQPDPSREVATADTDSWIQMMRPVIALAENIAGTEFVPKGLRNSVPATTAAILYGREVGLPPMTALTQTHVIEGKPSISAEGMRAMVFAAGHQIEFLETTGAVCRMRARRSGSGHWTELAWTIDMARAAGLLSKSNWKSYPRAMLIARCTGDLVRMVFPDVIHGFRTLEEMEDVAAPDQGGDAPAPSGSTKRVSRARKKAAAPLPAAEAPVERTARPERPTGPPLPGEDGYEAPSARATEQAGEVSESDGAAAVVPLGEEAADTSPAVEPEQEDAGTTEEQERPAKAKESPRPVTKAQVRMIMGQFGRLGMTEDSDRDARLLATCRIIDRDVESTNDLMSAEAHTLIDTLARVESRGDLAAVLDTIEQSREGGDQS